MSFIDELVAAAGRHGVPFVVVGGQGSNGNGKHADAEEAEGDEDDVVPTAPFMAALGSGTGDPEEVTKLRAQVQKLSAELQESQKRQESHTVTANSAVTPTVAAGDHGSADDLSIETLGFSDEALTRKLMRAGYETIGKLRTGFMDAKLASEEMKLKKDWLIEVGMKLAGALPSHSAPAAPATTAAAAAAASVSDCPAGHKDRPWLERLGATRQKQEELDEARRQFKAKQEEVAKLVKKKQDVPSELDDQLIRLEESIMKDEAKMVVLRWSLNIDHNTAVPLDEALKRANLGPWMVPPQPRLAPSE